MTLQQIATEAGVTMAVVSEVLRGRGERFRPETHKRIRETADRLGYLPNSAARAISNGHFGCVALVESTHPNLSFFPQPMAAGIHEALAAHNLHLTVARLPDRELVRDGGMPKLLREWMTDGLLINYQYRFPPALIDLIARHQPPAVWINSRQPRDCVYVREFEAAFELTRNMLGAGHRSVAYADYAHGTRERAPHYSACDRLAGYEAAMKEAGLPARRLSGASALEPGQGLAFSQEWLSSPDRPSAVVCYGGEPVEIILAAARLGLAVPGDLSLAALGATNPCYHAGVRVDAMIRPDHEIGRQAVERLVQSIARVPEHFDPVALDCRYASGDTVAPPRLIRRRKPNRATPGLGWERKPEQGGTR